MISSGDYYRALVSGRRRGVGAEVCRGGLRLLSVPYGWASGLRNWLYDRDTLSSTRVSVPVVSVGNLTLGGTGKTPCVEYVARFYRRKQLRVTILSRGYRGRGGVNDEALVLKENLPDVPHLQGSDRVALAQAAVKELAANILILDDGMQHRRLARNLDIVLIDATEPWGHGYLFPRGLLRESPSGLRRAGMILLTRCDQTTAPERDTLKKTIARLAPEIPVAETTHRPMDLIKSVGPIGNPAYEPNVAPLTLLRERPVAAFCGIGNPEAFRRTLVDLGAQPCAFRAFPDHHSYTETDIEALCDWARQLAKECVVVTTQKDLVKLPRTQLGDRDLYALRIKLHVESGQDALDRRLEEVVSGEW